MCPYDSCDNMVEAGQAFLMNTKIKSSLILDVGDVLNPIDLCYVTTIKWAVFLALFPYEYS